MGTPLGSVNDSLAFSSRSVFEFSMNLSISFLTREVYSYDQYHWCPITLKVTPGVFVSSIR